MKAMLFRDIPVGGRFMTKAGEVCGYMSYNNWEKTSLGSAENLTEIFCSDIRPDTVVYVRE